MSFFFFFFKENLLIVTAQREKERTAFQGAAAGLKSGGVFSLCSSGHWEALGLET